MKIQPVIHLSNLKPYHPDLNDDYWNRPQVERQQTNSLSNERTFLQRKLTRNTSKIWTPPRPTLQILKLDSWQECQPIRWGRMWRSCHIALGRMPVTCHTSLTCFHVVLLSYFIFYCMIIRRNHIYSCQIWIVSKYTIQESSSHQTPLPQPNLWTIEYIVLKHS